MQVAQRQKLSRRRKAWKPDVDAARLLIELREKKGIARDRVPYEMQRAGINRDRIPSSKTLYRVEEMGREPSIGIKAALAEFYGVDLHTIWKPREPRCARELLR